ncbi:probable LRR receptor-like serine/threonine-protein kinase At3g47570 [Ipomoea triloba]|uniref:probable LRR receptor-like serine/threonine-protein kinase At3g47570 n=1 Tax=Ipomoea triloba TaxID=35885 RepID=UPI00125D01F2|nr:probable LRR receptor-like serine/threonine-protein kinase At3g47570 [Ipomoea triloba]
MAFPTLYLISTKFVILLCFLSLLLVSCTSRLLGNETDKVSLLEFKKMIKDDPFGVMASWNETIHFCEWFGVSCSRRHQRVTSINLKSLKLVGSMPSHIGNISFLRVLALQNNSFSGEIPPEIKKLHRMQILYLNNNSFSGVVPSNISACQSLNEANFAHNNLTGNIPSDLGTLTNLQSIHFSRNNFFGKIPRSLGNLSLLYDIVFSINNLSGEIPNSLCRLPRLQYFAFAENNLIGTIPPSLFNHSSMLVIDVSGNQLGGTLNPNLFVTLPHLFFFSISGNNFIGSIPITLSNATNMQIFSANVNNLTGKVPNLGKLQKLRNFLAGCNNLGEGNVFDLNFLSSLTNATSLEWLNLGENNFGGFLPTSITNLSRNLRYFTIHANQVSGNIPRGISNLISLQTLGLYNNKISGQIPPEIGFLSNLRILFLYGNNIIGKIPSSLGNLTLLLKLDIGENYLHDKIPVSLGKCQNLESLSLAHNNLSGYIPKEVLKLSSLSLYLGLSYNQFIGSIPKEIGFLINLGILDMSYNSLFGPIPPELGSCIYLEALNLMNNNLEGSIPSTLENLRGMQFLQLSHNHLTGQIPAFFNDFRFLENLNLSYNDFEGAVPTIGIFNNTNSVTIVANRKLCGGIPQLNLPGCNTTKSKKKNSKGYLKIVIPLILGIVGLTVVVFILCLRWLKRQRKGPFPNLIEDPILRVSYHSLLKSTNGFSRENLLGVGGFGAVYRGCFDHDGTTFAVKVIDLLRHGASRSFVAECEILKNTRHRNLVKVLTACSGFDLQGNDFMALVYEYMDNGNLENWLHFSSQDTSEIEENRRLSFSQKLNILIDVANSLDYLHNHCEPAIIHCDLKPSNILLDESMTAHVSDFGLARFVQQKIQCFSENHSSNGGVRGTVGYAPPEYGFGSRPSKAGDVYSLGILILEMLAGRRPTDELFKDGLNLHGYAKVALPDRGMEIVDPKIVQERDDNFQMCLVSMITIGVACSVESPADRMNIHDVVSELNKAKKSLACKDY